MSEPSRSTLRVPLWSESGRGRQVPQFPRMPSAASRLGGPGLNVSYAASKSAVDTINWGLAQEVVAEGIRVNSVSPGFVDTEILPPGMVEELEPKLPMKRVAQPEEVSSAILFLLSDDSSYVAGASLLISGAR